MIVASEALDGTYGSLTFTSELPDGLDAWPEGFASYALVPRIEDGETLEVPGLPVGITMVNTIDSTSVTVPGTLVLLPPEDDDGDDIGDGPK